VPVANLVLNHAFQAWSFKFEVGGFEFVIFHPVLDGKFPRLKTQHF